MKKNILAVALASLSLGASAQDYTIEKWFNGKQSATVLTFDDWSPGQGSVAVPELVSRGLPASIYVTTANSFSGGGYPQMEFAAQNGIEIGNHTTSHPELANVSPSALINETTGAKTIIDNNVPSQNGVQTLVYPKGSWNQTVINQVKKDHIAARLFNDTRDYTFEYEFAQSENDYYKLKQIQVNNERMDATQMAFWMDHANTNNGLMIFTFHSIGASDTWFDQISTPFFNELLDVVESKSSATWITTMAAAVKYHKEAHCANLVTLSNNSSGWVLALTDTLSNNATYSQPLTIRLQLPQGETVSSVAQNGQNLAYAIVGNEVVFNAIPDGGNITLDKTGLTVSISNPTPNQVFDNLNAITFQGNATSQSGTITNVVFNVNGQDITATGTNPYTASWTPTTYGNYTVTLTAGDDLANTNVTSTSFSIEEAASCPIPAWTAQTYVGGLSVSYGGFEYKSKWWAGANNVPGAGNPWELIGICGEGNTNQAPTVSITAPVQTNYTALQEVTLSATANDQDGNVASVTFTIDGQDFTDVSAPFTVAYTPSAYVTVNVAVVATDDEGENSDAAALTLQFTEPNTAPTVVLDNPIDQSVFNSLSPIIFGATANDVDGTVAKVTYTVNGTNYDVISAPYSYSYTPSGAGNYTVSAVATDNDGAVSISESADFSVNVPNQAPTLSITSPSNGTEFTNLNDITFTVNAGDDNAVSKVTYVINGSATDVTVAPFSYTTTPQEGAYVIDAFATDAEGLTSATGSVSITVANVVSSCSETAWTNGSTYVANDLVAHNGEIWKAMWWNNSGEPGTTGEWGVWRSQGACAAPAFRKSESEANEELLLETSVYPNPNNGDFNLSVNDKGSVAIFNAQGVQVYQSNLTAGFHALNLDLATGIYMVLVSNDKTMQSHQVIVK
jgi:peptidoglycan/xylan/chitin deacetylase (PgdA/CDA1 family)/chitodextrinase/predicted 3-demethylubiquinone-9 3-methyltransferase (glyoxalase superfamily)